MSFNPYTFIFYGIIIVFCGLSFLAFVVSNIHNIINFFEKNTKKRQNLKKELKLPALTKDVISSAKNFMLLTANEKSFYLPLLIKDALEKGITCPWRKLDILIRKKIIIPNDEGKFLWNEDSACYKKIKKIMDKNNLN